MTTRVIVTMRTQYANPLDRDARRTVAGMLALDAAAREAATKLPPHHKPIVLARTDRDVDDDATFTYYTDHCYTFTDDPTDTLEATP